MVGWVGGGGVKHKETLSHTIRVLAYGKVPDATMTSAALESLPAVQQETKLQSMKRRWCVFVENFGSFVWEPLGLFANSAFGQIKDEVTPHQISRLRLFEREHFVHRHLTSVLNL